MALFDPNGKAYGFLSKISNIAVLNFWWVTASLPVVTFGAATTAMFASAYKVAKGEEKTVTHDFWHAFRQNLRQSTVIWLLLAAIGAVLGVDICFWYAQGKAGAGTPARVMLIVSLGFVVVWLLEILYVFAMQAYYENTIKNTLRNSLLFAYRNPGASAMLVVLLASGIALNCTILFVNLLFLIYGFGWFGYMAAQIHLGTFSKHSQRHEQLMEKQRIQSPDGDHPK